MPLLIEPVWNRNLSLLTKKMRKRDSFNRTSMESKRQYLLFQGVPEIPFNRTSMESKPVPEVFSDLLWRSFNRTSMESKRYFDCVCVESAFTF